IVAAGHAYQTGVITPSSSTAVSDRIAYACHRRDAISHSNAKTGPSPTRFAMHWPLARWFRSTVYEIPRTSRPVQVGMLAAPAVRGRRRLPRSWLTLGQGLLRPTSFALQSMVSGTFLSSGVSDTDQLGQAFLHEIIPC